MVILKEWEEENVKIMLHDFLSWYATLPILLILLYSVFLTIIYNMPESIAQVTTSPLFPTIDNLLLYRNSTYGIEIKYPYNWEIETGEDQSSIIFRSPPEDIDDSIQEYLKLEIYPISNITLDDVIAVNNNTLQNLSIIEQPQTTLVANNHARMLVYNYTDDTLGIIKGMKIATQQAQNVYLIRYLAQAEKFNDYLPTIQNMIDSFEIRPEHKQIQVPIKHDVITTNDTNIINQENTGWIYKINTPPDTTNITLSGEFISSNGQLLNITLVDTAKCNMDIDEGGFIYDFTTCSEFLINEKEQHANGDIQIPLQPRRLYNIRFQDSVSNENSVRVNLLLHYQNIFQIYANYTYYGVKLQYPSEWEKKDNGSVVKFLSPIEDDSDWYQENLLMSIHASGNKTLDESVKTDLEKYRQIYPEFKLIDSGITTLATNTAHYIVFTYTEGQDHLKNLQISMINDNKLYRFIYNALQENYRDYLQGILETIYSFNLVGFLPYDNSDNAISIQYPSDWLINNEDKTSVSFLTPENNTDSFVGIDELPSLGQTLNEYISGQVDFYKENFTAFQLLDSNGTTLSNNLAHRIVYRYRDQLTDNTAMDIYMEKNDIIYRFYYVDESYRYFISLPDVQKMVNSLNFQNINTIDNIEKPGLKLANGPTGIGVNPNTNRVYVTNIHSNTVSVMDGVTNNILDNITVGSSPNHIAVNPNKDSNLLYVANSGSNTVSVMDGVTNKLTTNIPVGKTPVEIAVDPDYPWIFVTNRDSGSVFVIDGETNSVVANITVGKHPYGISVNPVTNTLYVANGDDHTISVIDYFTSEGIFFKYNSINNIRIGSYPNSIAVNPVTNMLYVGDTNTVYVMDGRTNKIVDNIPLNAPTNVFVNPNKNMVYITQDSSNTVYVMDGRTNKIVDNITLGSSGNVERLAVNPITNIIYVSHNNPGAVYVLNSISNEITVGMGFKIAPTASGTINCNDKDVSKNDYIKYDINTLLMCKAKPTNGFLFNSWSGDLASNINTTNPLAQFNVTKYGTLIANFEKAPPPPTVVVLPKEYWESLYVIILSVIIPSILGWLVPYIADWYFNKRQRRYLGNYMVLIDDLYNISKQNKQDCIQRLDQVKIEITDLLKQGKINDSYYGILNDKISDYIEKISMS